MRRRWAGSWRRGRETVNKVRSIVHSGRAAQGTSVPEPPMPGARVERARGCPQGILSSPELDGGCRPFRQTPAKTPLPCPVPFPSIKGLGRIRSVYAALVRSIVHSEIPGGHAKRAISVVGGRSEAGAPVAGSLSPHLVAAARDMVRVSRRASRSHQPIHSGTWNGLLAQNGRLLSNKRRARHTYLIIQYRGLPGGHARRAG